MPTNFPADSIQYLVLELGESWWETSPGSEISCGDLVKAFVPHVDQLPFGVKPSGRAVATEHGRGILDVEIIQVGAPLSRRPGLPVAAMTLHEGEWWAAYRAKKRPCLVVAEPGDQVSSSLTRGMPSRNTVPALLAAPYYGVDRDGSRAGYNPRFADAVRHAKLRQFMVDQLPISGGPVESILRFDQIQPIGFSHQACEKLGFRLTETALGIIDDWLSWFIWDDLPGESWIRELHANLRSVE
ncbi:MAG: hypothetical protein V2B20_08660 [Pseudomonadota bacterium]